MTQNRRQRPEASLDLALIGNGTVVALIDRSGSICWSCMPRMDSPPVFDALLDSADGLPLDGAMTVELEGLARSEQTYDPATAVVRGRWRATRACASRCGRAATREAVPVRGHRRHRRRDDD